ncbi:MAG: hypothetical protein ACLFWG_08700 [Longimicrobiales bacterium]
MTLLETIRTQDLPREVFEAEDPTVTMPRRLGLSEVVNRQISRYREAAKKNERLTDAEMRDLIRLAIRRPDAQDIFFLVGESLGGDGGGTRLKRVLPDLVAFILARRRVRRLLKANFGRRLGGFASGSFTYEGRALPFIQADPGGDACALVTGLCQAVLDRYFDDGTLALHVVCQSRGDETCRWTASGRTPPETGNTGRTGDAE